ncbi:hypothetical protein [Candidatus Poriferisodalis sp.]|uniref:hypothetical protein n=1 Tax=Candidatus Poriferisodalis sp. TaxID=3101277 RepID=UPI003B52F131
MFSPIHVLEMSFDRSTARRVVKKYQPSGNGGSELLFVFSFGPVGTVSLTSPEANGRDFLTSFGFRQDNCFIALAEPAGCTLADIASNTYAPEPSSRDV